MLTKRVLENHCTIVTGGSSGIGRAIAEVFAEQGSAVVIADIQKEPREGGKPTHEKIAEETSAPAVYVECDVTDKSDLKAAVEAAEELGGVDTLVNNAGLLIKRPFFEITEEQYGQMMDVNVKGAFFASQIVGKQMAEAEGGSIINLSSTSGITGSKGQSVYCASKGAIRLLTYALAAELSEFDIRVNAIHPGVTETMQAKRDSEVVATDEDKRRRIETIPQNRVGSPQDIANTALFLASDFSEYINAESLIVDGGATHTK